ncbi:hypothetical protein [Desulfatitalea alkaliphila]|uniref:Uncharacterized protein n=1 Tax=Desulfatitalea alkaliphila TaxID=2929485 RepID=A0AA41R291_9BACT|nr:hypothetical protein [Desulfatitalea alkaliphila]MCJ8501632.1 hypothetical protein [Desulfatitalea alkaliphila]
MDLILTLDLSGHCIETELKRLYNRALAACLRPGGDITVSENIVELTRQALTRYDFGLLRSRYTALAGHSEVKVTLAAEQGEPVLRIDGRPVSADGPVRKS